MRTGGSLRRWGGFGGGPTWIDGTHFAGDTQLGLETQASRPSGDPIQLRELRKQRAAHPRCIGKQPHASECCELLCKLMSDDAHVLVADPTRMRPLACFAQREAVASLNNGYGRASQLKTHPSDKTLKQWQRLARVRGRESLSLRPTKCPRICPDNSRLSQLRQFFLSFLSSPCPSFSQPRETGRLISSFQLQRSRH